MSLGDGANKLYRDSGLGVGIGILVTSVTGAVAEFAANLPGYVSFIAAGVLGYGANLWTAYKAKRAKVTAALTD